MGKNARVLWAALTIFAAVQVDSGVVLEPDGGMVVELVDGGAFFPDDAGQPEVATPVVFTETGDGGVAVRGAAEVSTTPALFASTSGLNLRMRVGFMPEFGSQPGSPLGAVIGFYLGKAGWGAVLEGWTVLPSVESTDDTTGSLSAFSVGGLVGACYEMHLFSGALMGCVLGRGGAMLFEPRNVSTFERTWQPLASVGVRAGAEWPRESFFAFFASTQGFVPILAATVQTPAVSWRQSWLFGGFQVGFRLRLE